MDNPDDRETASGAREAGIPRCWLGERKPPWMGADAPFTCETSAKEGVPGAFSWRAPDARVRTSGAASLLLPRCAGHAMPIASSAALHY